MDVQYINNKPHEKTKVRGYYGEKEFYIEVGAGFSPRYFVRIVDIIRRLKPIRVKLRQA